METLAQWERWAFESGKDDRRAMSIAAALEVWGARFKLVGNWPDESIDLICPSELLLG